MKRTNSIESEISIRVRATTLSETRKAKEREVRKGAKREADKMKERILRSLSVFLAIIFLTSIAAAQNVTVRGQIVDEFSAVIPNAEITLVNKDGKPRAVKSNFNGEFSIPNVAPGIYTLTSTFQGFQPFVENDLKVPVAGGSLTITMNVASVNVVTDVAADNTAVSTEPDQNMNAVVLGEDFVKNLPDNEDDLRDFLNALAGPTAASGNGQGAEILVDGFGGGRLPPKEAIMQIRVNQNPFSAEYSNPGFGRIEIITKPGNDRWRGSGSWGYRNSALDARNAFAKEKPELTLNRWNFNFGGPIIKKRMSATVFADRNNSDGSNTTVARTLDGDFVANVPTQTINTFIGVRTDYLLNNKNTLNVSYNYRASESINQEFAVRFGGGFFFGGGGGFGGGGFGGGGGGSSNLLPERGSNRESTDHNLRISETWIINSKMIHEARFQYEREYSDQIPNSTGVAINVLDSFNGGGSTCCPNTATEQSFEYQDYLTVTSKGSRHTVKGGVQLQYDRYTDISGSNFNGTFQFPNLERYELALIDPLSPLGRATQFTINQGDPSIEYGMFRGSWFVGDDWRVKPNLTVSFGLRYEFQNRIDDQLNFAPRFGVAWSPFKSGKTTVRVGGGIFFDRLRNNQYENSIRFNGQAQQSYLVFNAIFAPTTEEAIRLNQLSPTSNTVLRPLDQALKEPYDINGSLILEQQLPKGFVGTITYLYSKGINQFRTRNINAPYPDPNDPTKLIKPFPDQGIIYQTESSANSQTNRISFGFNRRMGKLVTFGNYTLSWIKSNGEGVPANNYDLAREWGRSSADRRHTFFTGAFLTLPKGFRVNTFINASSGSPFNITTGLDANRDGSQNDRPLDADGRMIGRNSDLSASLYSLPQFNRLICPPGQNCNFTEGENKGKIDSSQLVTMRSFLQQNYPNGVIAQGPGSFSVTMNVSKTFGFGKSSNQMSQGGQGGGGGMGRGGGGGGRGGPGGGGPMMGGFGGAEGARFSLTLQVGVTNLFNRVNFGQYGGTLGSAFFGLPSSAGPARQFDFNVRFNF